MFAPGEKGKGTLHINIHQAKELPRMDPNGLTDGLVKCHLLPDKSAKGKRKTNVVKNNLNPVWEERFTYEKVTLEELSKERVLEACVCHNDPKGNNVVIGGIRLGSAPSGTTSKHKEWMDSIGEEVSHWEAMLTHPGEWVDRWHTLRHTMEPRSVDLSIPPSGSTSSSEVQVHKHLPTIADQRLRGDLIAPSVSLQTSPSIQEVIPKENSQSEQSVSLTTPSNEVDCNLSSAGIERVESPAAEPQASMQVKPAPEVTIQIKTEPVLKEISPSVKQNLSPPKRSLHHSQSHLNPNHLSRMKQQPIGWCLKRQLNYILELQLDQIWSTQELKEALRSMYVYVCARIS